jgi:hypothetical protein
MGDFLYICIMKNRKNNIVSLYMHTRKDNGKIFYIGIGVGKRPYAKGKRQRNHKWLDIVKEAGGFDVTILKDNLTWDDAGDLEVRMIAFYGREDKGLGPLCNLTDGKDGCIGRIMSEIQKKSMVDKQRKTYDEYITQVEEKWGFNLTIDRETFSKEYENQKSEITCDCVLHGVFKRVAHYIIAKNPKGCYDCMKIKKSKAMSEYERTPEYRKWASESRKGIDNQTKEFKEKLSKEMSGSGNRSAKLNDNDVRWIRKYYKSKDKVYGRKPLAKKFNVSEHCITMVVMRQTFQDVI